MAIQIRDVIRLTIASTSHIEEGVIDQVVTILANEKRLDELSEKQKKSDKKSFLGRPRKWTAMCIEILDEQASRNKNGNHEHFTTAIKKQLSMPISEESPLINVINDEGDHREELLALSKYFSNLRQKEELLQAELKKLFNSNSALNEAHEYLSNGNICAAYEKLVYDFNFY
uniref:Transcriptional regulator n=1 Tax=Ascaris lumbricoides TaxID=6252 RepID=A0A0M3I6W2_ASCLU